VYFDHFNHPLTTAEIFAFMPHRYTTVTIENALSSLLNDCLIFKTGGFYALRDEPSLAERRTTGHKAAIAQLVIAKRIARFLSRFPYVETIAVSGSLSKYYADENTDIDFFIITSANRLWIARTCMHLFKKLSFIVGKQHWFCMNYYIDEMKMEIPEKNLFTAIEIVTLLPLEGGVSFKKFIDANSWVKNFLPCFCVLNNAREIQKGFIRNGIEKILNFNFFDSLEDHLMAITDKRWKKKSGKQKKGNHSKRIGMAVGKHFSKPDPKIFQKKILQQYDNRVQQLTRLLHPADVN
jgi:hypothetical protein